MTRKHLRTLSIMNAAMAVTRTKFLPEVLRTLHVLRSDAGIKLKPIVWHGSSYRFRRRQCEDTIIGGNEDSGIRVEEYLAAILEGENKNATDVRQLDDPWGLYHDTQGKFLLSL
jgi:hypothetical protein